MWVECSGGVEVVNVWLLVGKAFRCVHEVDVDGSTVFRVYYTVEGLDDPSLAEQIITFFPATGWAETVPDVDADSNGVPDDVERVGRSLVESWQAYNALGYRTPGGLPIEVAIHDANGPQPGSVGLVLPPTLPGGSTLVHVSNSGLFDYLARHELYHLFQYQYVGVADFGVGNLLTRCLLPFLDCPSPVRQVVELNWFQELTAEWATHQVQEWHAQRGTPLTGELDQYADSLPFWFSQLDGGLLAWDGFGGRVQYGSFTLAEFLEERFPDILGDPNPSIVRQIWERLDAAPSSALSAVEVVVADNGGSWETLLPAYAQANYVVASPDPTRPYRDGDAEAVWRDSLDLLSETAGTVGPIGSTGVDPAALGLDRARPARSTVAVETGTVSAGSVTVGPGGMAYVELIPPDGFSGSISLRVSGVTSAVDVQVMPFAVYPTLCAQPEPLVDAGDGLFTGEFPIDGTCRFVTLVVTNTNPYGGSISVDWEAAPLADVNLLLNPGFETGDFTGWSLFDPQDAAEFGIRVSNGFIDPVEGAYAASVYSTAGIGPAGYEQQVPVIPGGSYLASVQVGRFSGAYPSAALEVLDNTGTVVASDTVEFGIVQEWRRLAVAFVAPSDTVTFRIVWLHYQTGEDAEVWFDDTRLEPSEVPANLAFEAGTLNGWTADPANPGTVFEVRPDGAPGASDPYAAHLLIPGSAFGSEQLTRTVRMPGVTEASVLVSGTAGAVATLEVTDAGGTGTDSVTLTGPDEWALLSVPITTGDQITIRLIGDRGTQAGAVDIAFDGVNMGGR